MNSILIRVSAFAVLVCLSASADGQIFRRGVRFTCGPNGCQLAGQTLQALPAGIGDSGVAGPGGGKHPGSDKPVGFWDKAGVFQLLDQGEVQGKQKGVPETATPKMPMQDHPPAIDAPALEPWQLSGVDPTKLNWRGRETYSCSGRECTKYEALEAALEDDSNKLWLIVTGAGRDRMLADLRSDPSFSELLSRTRIWSQADEHWSLAGKGYASGSPGIYFALPDGTELYRAVSYTGPSDLQALRVSDPLFKPMPAPPTPAPLDPLKPSPDKPNVPSPSPHLPNALAYTLILIACGVLLWLLQRK